MNILVILAHPSASSFNHAIADTVRSTLVSIGHNVWFHDLYAEKFPPALPAEEIPAESVLPEEIAVHCRELAAADGIVIVHPNWWGMPPALLKGWIDRVIRAGVAYKFQETDSGEGVPMGLLAADTAVVFNTSNTPPERERSVFKDPLETIWKNCIFDLCGVRRFERRTFGVVVTSTNEERQAWLEEVREIVIRNFPAAASAERNREAAGRNP